MIHSQKFICSVFGPKNKRASLAVLTLHHLLGAQENDKTLADWKRVFWKTNGVNPEDWTSLHDSLVKSYGIAQPAPHGAAEILFAVQTYFAQLLQMVIRVNSNIEEPSIYDWPELLHSQNWNTVKQNLQSEIEHFPWDSFAGQDIFGSLYRELFPRGTRQRLGEFYTPNWLAEHLLDVSGFDPHDDSKILDPACGSGIFLLAAARRILKQQIPKDTIANRINGFDLNPLAVLMCRANFAVMLKTSIPVFILDSIQEDYCEEPSFDLLLGNPPWVHWDKLPAEYREATGHLWRQYGLFSLSGREAQYGGAKKELALLMIMRTVDHFLKKDGKLAMVLPQSVFQTKKAGDGFRRFGDTKEGSLFPAPRLNVLRVDDFSSFRVFEDAATKTATILLQKNQATRYPVPYYCWSSSEDFETCQASPVNPEDIGSPWRITTVQTIRSVVPRPSDYRAMLGANTGGANGVYWVEVLENRGETSLIRNLANCSHRMIPMLEAEIETELLYPLLRWKDVDSFSAKPSSSIIMTQDPMKRVGISEENFKINHSLAYRYLLNFESLLRERSAYKKYHHNAPFYSMYNVSTDTFAKIKVVWRRMESRIRAAVVETANGKPMIPQETCSMIAVENKEEAVYLAAILNSQTIHQLVTSFTPRGSKGFGSPGMLEYLPIPKFQTDHPIHRELSELDISTMKSGNVESLIEQVLAGRP